jgi:hydrogenase nickel incorporation protein HypA/HybF
MHELGVIIEVVRTVEKIAAGQNLKKIESLTLQIGKLSSIVPEYIEKSYPVAVDGTILQDTKLIIDVLPANGMCRECGHVYDIVDNQKICPYCKAQNYDILGGREFFIKEISAC